MRYFLNGERLNQGSSIRELCVESGDVIEAFKECFGGGPPTRRHLLDSVSEKEILSVLEESSEQTVAKETLDRKKECFLKLKIDNCEREIADLSEFRSEQNLEKQQHSLCQIGSAPDEPVPSGSELGEEGRSGHKRDKASLISPKVSQVDHRSFESEVGQCVEVDEASQICFEVSQADVSSLQWSEVGPSSQEVDRGSKSYSELSQLDHNGSEGNIEVHPSKGEDKETEDLLKDLRIQIQTGEFSGKSSLHKQILFYMKLPKLQKFEKDLIKTLLERIRLHSILTIENKENFPKPQKKSRKRKNSEAEISNLRCLRKRKGNQETRAENIEIFDKNYGQEINSLNSTPRQRLKTCNIFGIVSPFIIQAVPTLEEVRRFSLAVHMWAVECKGSVEFLHTSSLNERHVQDILLFAGPGSRWKLIADRSVIEYLSIWQNSAKGKEHFHGDQETGYQSKSKLHSSAIQFCPFAHCLSVPGIFENLVNDRKDEKVRKITSRRELFATETTTDNNIVNSPTKEELKVQNEELKQKILKYSTSNVAPGTTKSPKSKIEEKQLNQPKLVECAEANCTKSFVTVFGMQQHYKKIHGVMPSKKDKQNCPFCGKLTVYVHQHIKTVHKEMVESGKCEVCQQVVKSDLRKHRGECIKCRFCDYTNRKKDRLLKHIDTHLKEQTNALDLSTPRKQLHLEPVNPAQFTSPMKEVRLPQPKPDSVNPSAEITKELPAPLNLVSSKLNEHQSENCHTQFSLDPRSNFPFDDATDPYESEYESEDDEEFTKKRRMIKDQLELELRDIDQLKSKEADGDSFILEQFESFMRKKSNKDHEVSTVKMYTSAIKNDVLPTFHKLFEPFDARWLIDCTSKKECTCEGEKRFYARLEDPIYITPKVVQSALEFSKEKGGQQGGKRGTIINAIVQLMNFVEIYFNGKMNNYGREPFENAVMYHSAVRKFINSTGTWKMCNNEKDRAQHENRLRKAYEHPNREMDLLQKYNKYKNSTKRLQNIATVTNMDKKKSSDTEMTKIALITMGEIVAASGCRPAVLLKMPNEAYIDKEPGFNPYETTEGDCIEDEDDGGEKIYRRVNPNLPPRHRACKHQLEQNKAECPVMCDDRCDPDGYNIRITWDKTAGPSYLHIPKELKHMMDVYDIKKVRHFKGRKSPNSEKADWIHNDKTPFFLNSSGTAFKFLNLAHISEAMGMDVTAYNFRKIVSTWALSHDSLDIRRAEQETLQHSLKVATAHYQQNKQIQPQKLVQKYVAEENLFPESLKDGIAKAELETRDVIKRNEQIKTKKRIETLNKRKEDYLTLTGDNKPLGPKHRIYATDRKMFTKLLMEMNGFEKERDLANMRPLKWRNIAVRTVCSDHKENGPELRRLWKKMYQGDLQWGVRDLRLKAEQKNWPLKQVTHKKDRNSWIAASIRQSIVSQKLKKKKCDT